MPQVVRHHTVIVGVVSGLVLTVVTLAVCATCHQSRRERRRLHKLSNTISTATELPNPTQQRAGQLTNVDDHRVHDVTGTGSASTAQNHQPHGWMGLANGGQCIQRDDGLRLTSISRAGDDRPYPAVCELPTDNFTNITDRTPSHGYKLPSAVTSNAGPAVAAKYCVVEKHDGRPTSGAPATISAVATIEKRPVSPSTDVGRESNTSPRPDVVQHEKFQYPTSRFAQSTSLCRPPAAEVHATDASAMYGGRICPGWSASVMPVAAAGGSGSAGRSQSGTLVHPNCVQAAPSTSDRQWQRSASVRWTSTGSSSRRSVTSSAALPATRSTSELYDDVRPRLGATHSIVF